MSANIYTDLTREFNAGGMRAILAGGQAAVLHRIAFMSKDGDWIIREDNECTEHILNVLANHGASYRFGAPLDIRWLCAGWSAHLEFQHHDLRIRTDFFTRPPRISEKRLALIWQNPTTPPISFVEADNLAEMKKTNREKDYVVIGELARRMSRPQDQLLYSRSARDLLILAKQYPDHIEELTAQRPLLQTVKQGQEALEQALDAERRQLIHANERRLHKYMEAAQPWQAAWSGLLRQMRGLPLAKAHELMCEQAERFLPKKVPGAWP